MHINIDGCEVELVIEVLPGEWGEWVVTNGHEHCSCSDCGQNLISHGLLNANMDAVECSCGAFYPIKDW